MTTSPAIRIIAPLSITCAPWESAKPIIREAAETDLDPKVRAVARDILADHAPR
jgi:hypothetical protein